MLHTDRRDSSGNESFILAYGFLPADNPHDDVVLKLGGLAAPGTDIASQSAVATRLQEEGLSLDERHIIGTDGSAPDRLWQVLRAVCGASGALESSEGEMDLEREMDASDVLRELLEGKMASLQRLVERWEAADEQVGSAGPKGIRQEVYEMCGAYLSGGSRYVRDGPAR